MVSKYPIFTAIAYASLAEVGSYFIDTRFDAFDRIIDYLATGKMSYECFNDYEIQVLKDNIDYFQLKAPAPPVKPPVVQSNRKPASGDYCRSCGQEYY